MRWAIVLVLLAGCSSSTPATVDEGVEPVPDVIGVPTWEVGDHWTFQFNGRFQGTASLVVTADDGAAYTIETNEPQLAYIDAQGDASMIGPQRKADLAGSQGPTVVEYLRFPLEDGARWSTVWDGAERDVLATKVGPGVFELTATEADGYVAVEYTYDHAKRWITEYQFNVRGGDVVTIQLTSSGADFKGTIYRYEIDEPIRVNLVGLGAAEAQFTMGEAVTEVGLVGHADCGGSGMLYAALRAPEDGAQPVVPLAPLVGNPDWEHNIACPGGGPTAVDTTLPAASGPWEFRAISSSEGSSVVLDVEPRTLIAVPFPS